MNQFNLEIKTLTRSFTSLFNEGRAIGSNCANNGSSQGVPVKSGKKVEKTDKVPPKKANKNLC